MQPQARDRYSDLEANEDAGRMGSAIVALASMEGQVKQTLDAPGVSVIQFPFHIDVGRVLRHMTNEAEMSG